MELVDKESRDEARMQIKELEDSLVFYKNHAENQSALIVMQVKRIRDLERTMEIARDKINLLRSCVEET